MEFKTGETYNGFCVKETWEVKEIDSLAYLLAHEKTGAMLLYLKNTDDNKVFSVAFRTPPVDSCGTPHIMEHSVLCGSQKYPLKEPFVELIKSSMNTFVNAMTYPDKTVYPVASRIQADLLNLTDVYLDAVFHPLMRTSDEAFKQEGWHWHLEDRDEEIKINGVVYNEMKGAYGSPDDVLENTMMKALYPDTAYALDSGGNPDVIPELTYEKYLDFYNTHYHPSNASFYLYGDMDPLPFLDKIASSIEDFDKVSMDTAVASPAPFAAPAEVTAQYSIGEKDKEETSAYFTLAWRVGTATDSGLSYAINVLNGILMDTDASPLKKALLQSGLAQEYYSDLVSCLIEPCFSVTARGGSEKDFARFQSVVMDVLTDLAENGIDEELILAAMNSYEFDLREADSGNMPKGLLYLQDILESWIYDGHPTAHLTYETYLADLRTHMDSPYWQSLIREFFLENRNAAAVCLIPVKGLTIQKEEALAKKLAEKKASMTPEEIEDLVSQTLEMMKRQAMTDPEEIRNKVPSLELSQIPEETPKPDFAGEAAADGATVYTHKDKTRGIVYCDFYFPFTPSSPEDISTAELLSKLLCAYETENYDELALAKELGMYIGDASTALFTWQNVGDPDAYEAKFCFYTRVLPHNTAKMFALAEEILCRLKTPDTGRLLLTVAEEISKFETRILTGGHAAASQRLNAYATRRGAFTDRQNGFGWYLFLKKVQSDLEAGGTEIAGALTELLKKIVSHNPDVLITAGEEDTAAVKTAAIQWLEGFGAVGGESPQAHGDAVCCIPEPLGDRKEAFVIPSGVNYVGRGTNFLKAGLSYLPCVLVTKIWLSTVFLWDNIRLVGGAYGAFFSVSKDGHMQFLTYRDPHIAESLAIFEESAKAVREAEITSIDLKKLIIGTIADIDAPRAVYATGRAMLGNVYRSDTWENQQENRKKILKTTIEDIRKTASLIEEALAFSSAVCVVGSEREIEKNKELFDGIHTLSSYQPHM